MKKIQLGKSGLTVPNVAVGCMRIPGLDSAGAEKFVHTAVELGLNFFDHADIYGGGESEKIFAKAAKGIKREDMFLQSKCGIGKGEFDFSKAHILDAADGILQRLETDYLDVLLLHRPDALVEPEEVAEAFDLLHSNGKVRHFGVSNQNPMQIMLLQKYLRQPIIANQLQLSIMHAGMIAEGIHVNMDDDAAVNRSGSVLDFCRLNDITVQAWSPYQVGFFKGPFIDNPKYPELNAALGEIGGKHGVDAEAIALAWLTRHPAKMQVVTGTTKVARLASAARGADVTLTRGEWYQIYRAAGHTLP